MAGSNKTGKPGVYGKLGTPAAANIPGNRSNAVTSTDKDGHLWLFGGEGYVAGAGVVLLNDLWEFNPSISEWTWRSGSSTISCVVQPCGHSGVYGTLGTPAPGNVPGGRLGASSWIDDAGNFWLFGGQGYDSQGNKSSGESPANLNDLWKFNPLTNEWTWMGGSTMAGGGFGHPGVYGKLGTPAAENIPGSRYLPNSWTDRNGYLWLFGGYGADANGHDAPLNDLWRFNPSTIEWTWVAGSNTIVTDGFSGRPGKYGALGVPAAGNTPGGRYFASSSADSDGHFWIFGGDGYDASGNGGYLNDLWEFDPATNRWAWMGGNNTVPKTEFDDGGQLGVYGKLGVPAVGNRPGGRESPATWTDSSGNFWLFGGLGIIGSASADLSYLDDLWELDPFTNEWAWMGGSSTVPEIGQGQPGIYGQLGIPDASNKPGGRYGASSWTGAGDDLWLFGGEGVDDSTDELGFLNDLWRYEPSTTSIPAAATPSFSLLAGVYKSPVTVSISGHTEGATIYYRLDGAEPAEYKAPLAIAKTTTVRAMAAAAGYSKSAMVTATYVIAEPQTITFTPPASHLAYGVKPISLSAKASSGLPVEFTVLSGPAKVSGNELTITGEGSVVVAANQAGNSEYAAAEAIKQTIEISKAKLTVTATSFTIKKGQPLPKLTYTIKGFVDGDTQARATAGVPKLKLDPEPGGYKIVISTGTLDAKNYSFAFVDGKVTVE